MDHGNEALIGLAGSHCDAFELLEDGGGARDDEFDG
jgi:hypothetical protein